MSKYLLTWLIVGAVTAAPAAGHTQQPPWSDIDYRANQACPYAGYEGMGGCAFTDERPVRIFVRISDVHTIQHETGHAFDALVMDDADRTAWAAIMRRPWHPEGFAESYYACATHNRWGGFFYDFTITKRQYRAVCRLLWNA